MKTLFLSLALLAAFSTLVSAKGTEIGYTDVPLNRSFDLEAANGTNFQVVSAVVTKEASKEIVTEDENCLASESGSELACRNVQVLETRPVVQVTLSYENPWQDATDGSNVHYVTLSQLQSDFSAAQLQTIAKIGNNAAKLFKVSEKQYSEAGLVYDDQNTPACYAETQSDCPAPVYKEGEIKRLEVGISLQK